jgi:hypothetical protein
VQPTRLLLCTRQLIRKGVAARIYERENAA